MSCRLIPSSESPRARMPLEKTKTLRCVAEWRVVVCRDVMYTFNHIIYPLSTPIAKAFCGNLKLASSPLGGYFFVIYCQHNVFH